MTILLGVFFFFLSIITLLDYQDVFSFANPCFKKKTKTMRYIGRSCSYGESVLILQRKNKAFSFIFPCLMMKPKLRRELLMNWVLVNWKRKMVSINWLNFYTPVWKTDVLCRGNVSRLSVRPSLRPSSVRVFQTFLCLRLKDRAHLLTFKIFICEKFSCFIVLVVFLAATKQLYEWYFLSVCPSVRLSVCHTFLTMFPLSYHHEIFRIYHMGPG